jgi:hypothetical protein
MMSRNSLFVLLKLMLAGFVAGPYALTSAATLSGTYLGDARPHALYYVTLIQSKNGLNGSMMEVWSNNKGGTDSTTLSLSGSANDGLLVLTATAFLDKRVLNGKQEGSVLSLSIPMSSGRLTKLVLTPSTDQGFNKALEQWRDSLRLNYAQRQKDGAAREEEARNISALANRLAEALRAISMSELRGDAEAIQSSLKSQRKDVGQLEVDLKNLKKDASVRPMTCYQAHQTVGYDFNQTMGYTYNTSLEYNARNFQRHVDSLEKQLSSSSAAVAQVVEHANSLEAALRVRRFNTQVSPQPAAADAPLASYQNLVMSTQNNIGPWMAEKKATAEKAAELMHDGQRIAQEAQALVRCQ